MSISQTNRNEFNTQGFTVARELFSADEVENLKQHFMVINGARGPETDDRLESNEPLAKYPRVMQPHRWDELSLEWLIDERLNTWLTTLLAREPYAAQTMFYFKPPGSRGQALHQDQFFLRVDPGTCVAAWMAVDPCDEENGCLQVVPGTHNLPVLCSTEADPTISFTSDTVELPEGMEPVPVALEPGDVLFFNGQLVHGSYPNTSQNRFRRAMIGHYAVGEAEAIANWYHPVLHMDGTEAPLGFSEHGGPCGVWVDVDGVPVARVEGVETRQGSSYRTLNRSSG